MKLINLFSLTVMLFIVGCASSKLTSYTDPEFINKHYKTFVVDYLINDLNRKRHAETEVVRLLKEKGIKAYMGLQIFPPTRKYTGEEAAKIIVNTGAEGYITIALTNEFTTTTYTPRTHTTTPSYYGGYTTSSSGGYSMSSPTEEFKIELTDMLTGRMAYQATGITSGTEFSNDIGMAKTLAKGLVEKLIEDRIVIPTIKEKNNSINEK